MIFLEIKRIVSVLHRHISIAAVLGCTTIVMPGATSGETLFFENFERVSAPVPHCWYGPGGKSQITSERAFSGKRSALIETGAGYWDIPLPQKLKWDRKDPAGVGNRPLYLSMRVWTVSGGTHGSPGFRASIVPKRHPPSGGATLYDATQANATGATGEWLLQCFDISQFLRDVEVEGSLNPDHVILESVSFFTFSGGTFYLDDLRLSTERPEGWSPPPSPKVDTAAYYRPDPKLESMVLHGVYGGVGSALGDTQLHASVVRDVKRHYLNFVFGIDFRVESPEPLLQAVERTLDQAAQYDILFLPSSYIGDKYAKEARAWNDDKLRAEMLKIVRRFKNKTHLLGWYLEEESQPDRALTCLKQKRWVEQEDPQHSVWNIFNAGVAVQTFGAAYSVIAADLYPIAGAMQNPWAVPDYLAGSVPKFKQPFLLAEQTFGGCGWTAPTLGQWRLMVYGAMAEGVKGFFHFLYRVEPPLYHLRNEPERMSGGLVDEYGTPSPIYREIERHLGPDLFSFGELLRTCRPSQVPAEIRVECAKVENYLEKKRPAIAVRRLADTAGGYEILALYSNDPDKVQTGALQIPASLLGDRIVMDLSAHSRDILSPLPIQIEGERVALQLDPGDGRFLALATRKDSDGLIRRMQRRRFEALRQMVEFDCRWLAQVKVGEPYSAKQWADLQQLCDQKSPRDALEQVMRLERANHASIGKSSLAPVIRDLDVAREHLTAASDAIKQWAIPKTGQPFPPDVEPGKSYCAVQDKLAELYVGFSDLAYSHTPEELVRPVAELVRLSSQHAEQLKKEPGNNNVPKEPCRLTLDTLKPLEKQLAALGWSRPATNSEIQREAEPSSSNDSKNGNQDAACTVRDKTSRDVRDP